MTRHRKLCTIGDVIENTRLDKANEPIKGWDEASDLLESKWGRTPLV